MKKSTDMFLAKDSRVIAENAIVLENTTEIQGEKFSPYVVSLRNEYIKQKKNIPLSAFSLRGDTSKTENNSVIESKKEDEKNGVDEVQNAQNKIDELFSREKIEESDIKIPSREMQIQKTLQTMENFKNFSKSPSQSQHGGGFFRNLKQMLR